MTSWRISVFAAVLLAGQGLGSAQDAPAAKVPARTNAPAPASASAPPPTLTQDQIKDLIRAVAQKDDENDKKLRDYTFFEFDKEHRLDGKGNVKSSETRKYEVLQVYGEEVRRLVEKDGKPLPGKDAAKEEAKVQQVIDKRKSESGSEREKRLKHEEKQREEGRAYVKEIADAFNFTFEGTEAINGRDAYVIRAEPRPGYVPHKKEAKLLEKVHGRIWIDRADSSWVKLDVEVMDTISIGLFLARLHKGTRIQAEQARVNDEVWLPRHFTAKVDVRVALLKEYNVDEDTVFSDYRKFRTDTKVTGVAEVQEK